VARATLRDLRPKAKAALAQGSAPGPDWGMKRILPALAPVLLLSACLGAGVPRESDTETCPASQYGDLIGQPESAIDSIDYDKPIRSYPYGHRPMTTDHRPERMNFELSPDGIILRITCG